MYAGFFCQKSSLHVSELTYQNILDRLLSQVRLFSETSGFPRISPLGSSVNILVDCRLRVDQEALSDNRTGPSPLADPEHKLDEVLLRCGVLKRTCVDRLVGCISVQLLDNLTCLLLAAPQVARGRD